MFPPGLLTFLAVLLSLSASVTALVSQLEPQGNSSQTAAGNDKVGGDLCLVHFIKIKYTTDNVEREPFLYKKLA